jgi:hypothetical protein
MTKYVETMNVQPTTTKTILVTGGTFSWAPQNDRLANLGVVEVTGKKGASDSSKATKKVAKR